MSSSVDIELRAIEPEDATLMYMWENDRELWRFGRTHAPLSLHQIREYIDGYSGDVYAEGQLRLMICAEGKSVGMVDLYDIDAVNRRAGVGIMVSKEWQHRGVGQLAIARLAEYSGNVLGLHQLWCVCGEENTPALQLFRSQGFSINGRLRSWVRIGQSYRDAYLLQRLLVN